LKLSTGPGATYNRAPEEALMAVPETVRPDGRAQLPALTGVRAVAAFLVLSLHATQNFPSSVSRSLPFVHSGHLGVDLFFILSGFIIAHVYLRKLVPLRAKPIGVFLWHRFIRLFPAHAAVLIGLIVLVLLARAAGIQFTSPSGWDARDLPWHFLMLHAWGVVDTANWNAPSWSISAEWFAYLLFPVVAAAALALPRFAALPLAAAVLLLAAIVYWLNGWWLKPAWVGAPALIRVEAEFICGLLLYCWMGDAMAMPSRWSDGLAFGAMATFAIGTALGFNDFVLVALLAVTILGVAGRGVLVRAVFAQRAMVWLGEISYSIYLVHFPVLLVMRNGIERAYGLPGSVAMQTVLFAASLLVVTMAAAVLFYLVENPARRRLRDLFGKIDAAPLAGAPVPAYDRVGDRIR
jgi:peptidoglycan/LPS O-acetylase OafA/YrhL